MNLNSMPKQCATFTIYKHAEEIKHFNFIVNTLKSNIKSGAELVVVGCGCRNISLTLGSLCYDVIGVEIHVASTENARKLNTFTNIQFDLLVLLC